MLNWYLCFQMYLHRLTCLKFLVFYLFNHYQSRIYLIACRMMLKAVLSLLLPVGFKNSAFAYKIFICIKTYISHPHNFDKDFKYINGVFPIRSIIPSFFYLLKFAKEKSFEVSNPKLYPKIAISISFLCFYI